MDLFFLFKTLLQALKLFAYPLRPSVLLEVFLDLKTLFFFSQEGKAHYSWLVSAAVNAQLRFSDQLLPLV